MKDRNGQEIQVGAFVRHAEAAVIPDRIIDHNSGLVGGWPARPQLEYPRRDDGKVPLCPPFKGRFVVKEVVSSRCVRLDPMAGIIPIYLGSELEVVD